MQVADLHIFMHPRRLQNWLQLWKVMKRQVQTLSSKLWKLRCSHISANAGLEGSVIINKVRESEPGVGFDALNEKYVDMVGAGILDPVKVTRSALQNATSVASTLLTTESVVATIKEDAPAMPAGAPGMGGMM